jgi:hypothetical protein
MIRDPGLMGGYKRIIAQTPRLWKAENFGPDAFAARPASVVSRRQVVRG